MMVRVPIWPPFHSKLGPHCVPILTKFIYTQKIHPKCHRFTVKYMLNSKENCNIIFWKFATKSFILADLGIPRTKRHTPLSEWGCRAQRRWGWGNHRCSQSQPNRRPAMAYSGPVIDIRVSNSILGNSNPSLEKKCLEFTFTVCILGHFSLSLF